MNNKNIYKALCEYGEAVIEIYRAKLQQNNKNGTGELSRSLTLDYEGLKRDLDNNESVINLVLIAADHIEQVEEGRLPTKNSGNGELQQKILEWIEKKPIQKRPIGNGTLPTNKQLAFLISRKIHNEGYHGTHILKEAIEEAHMKFIDKIYAAIEQDVSEYVKVAIDTTILNLFQKMG